MITNNSKSKKQQKINNYSCTSQQVIQPMKITGNKELIRTLKLNIERKTTTNASPMTKTTNKVAKTNNKNKNKKEIKIEDENKKLRGYLITLGQNQKLKSVSKSDKSETSSKSVHAPESQSQDLFLEGSPETAPHGVT